MKNLQDEFAPKSVCFGCGPANPVGLHIKSRPEGEELVADWEPQPHHTSFRGFVSGGIISTLLDCHGNWTAAYSLMSERNAKAPPGTVTAEYSVRFLRPTPIGDTLRVRARAVKVEGNRVSVEGSVESGGETTATMSGLFVAVKEGHPAYHRWE